MSWFYILQLDITLQILQIFTTDFFLPYSNYSHYTSHCRQQLRSLPWPCSADCGAHQEKKKKMIGLNHLVTKIVIKINYVQKKSWSWVTSRLCSDAGANLRWLQHRFPGIVVTLVQVQGNGFDVSSAVRSCRSSVSCFGTYFSFPAGLLLLVRAGIGRATGVM